MSRARFFGRVLATGVLNAAFVLACSGKSTSEDGDSGDDDSGGTAGTSSTGGTAGTGGVPPDGTCDDIMPCGGDPTGTWTIRENCLEVVVPGLFEEYPGCENVVPVGSGTLEGTFTFENGMATQNTQQTVNVTVIIDDPCAQAISELPVSANDLCPLLDQMLMMDATTPATCVATPDGCRCDGTQTPEPTLQTDTYEVIGNRLLLGSGDAFDFCEGERDLSLSGSTVDPASGATADLMLLLDRE